MRILAEEPANIFSWGLVGEFPAPSASFRTRSRCCQLIGSKALSTRTCLRRSLSRFLNQSRIRPDYYLPQKRTCNRSGTCIDSASLKPNLLGRAVWAAWKAALAAAQQETGRILWTKFPEERKRQGLTARRPRRKCGVAVLTVHDPRESCALAEITYEKPSLHSIHHGLGAAGAAFSL